MKINLICGESYLLINEEIKKIVRNSTNITTLDILNSSIEDILTEINYVPMFAEDRYIIIKNANFFGTEKLKESDNELLLKYLENPGDTTIIFVCNTKLDLRKKITKIIKDKYNLINIPTLKVYEIEKRLLDVFNKNNYKIDNESIKYIVKASLNNYDIAMNEVEKIMLYYDNPSNITYNDILNITSSSINTNNFLFVDSLIDGDLENSLKLFQDLKTMKVEPSIILSLIARDYRILLSIKKLLEQNKREYEIMKELNLQDWQVNKYLKKAFPYKIKELESILIKLSDLDLNIKTGKIDKYIALELFILDVCA